MAGLTDVTAVGAEAGAEATSPVEPWRPSTAGYVARLTFVAVVLGFLVALPYLVPAVFLNVVARAVVYAIVALSMNVLVGYTGQVSLGHQAFVGIGAFSAGVVLTTMELPFAVALLFAASTGAVAALILGGVALRVRGLYLAVVTIAYGLFAQNTLFNIRELTGGGAGQPVPRPEFASGSISYIYFCYAILALVWIFDWRLTATKAGRAIQALRDDERVAATWGINVTGYKLLAFVISGAIAGFAGALFGAIEEVAVAPSFGLTLGLIFLLMTVVGGLGSRAGVVQGAVVFATIGTFLDQAHEAWASCASLPPRALQFVLGVALVGGAVAVVALWVRGRPYGLIGTTGRFVGALGLVAGGAILVVGGLGVGDICLWARLTALYEPLIGALLLVLTLIFFPGGIAEQQEDLRRWLSFGPFHEHHGEHAEESA